MTAGPRFSTGQRVRLTRDPRATGRVTGTGVFPGGTGVEVTMDNRFSPRPTPVRHHTLGKDFEPLPGDYLDDGEALELITAALAGAISASAALTEIISVMRRNDRIKGS